VADPVLAQNCAI